MEKSVAIKVEGLGKRYQLGVRNPYGSLRDSIMVTAKGICRSFFPTEKPTEPVNEERHADNTLWALRDVSFEVARGDILGIIGRNGAGKSTLLKLLSRITFPTEGGIDLFGRVGSLLEVGTGFHPELTGKENIYLNGTLLGMNRQEVKSRFDEIVDFSEIHRFIDTPVKRYSSGMYTRLAFAVAAHLKPEILIVDEVLAVGDIAFQQKCLGKMDDVAKEGRTVLFVSHSMNSIHALCKRVLLIDEGRLIKDGPCEDVVDTYQKLACWEEDESVALIDRTDRGGTGEAIVTDVVFRDTDLHPIEVLKTGKAFYVDLHYRSDKALEDVQPGVGFDNRISQRVVTFFGQFTGQTFKISPGDGVLRCYVEGLPIRPDQYHVAVFLGNPYGAFDVVHNAVTITVEETGFYPTGSIPELDQGHLMVKHEWSCEP